jgi:hypothetical protein
MSRAPVAQKGRKEATKTGKEYPEDQRKKNFFLLAPLGDSRQNKKRLLLLGQGKTVDKTKKPFYFLYKKGIITVYKLCKKVLIKYELQKNFQ